MWFCEKVHKLTFCKFFYRTLRVHSTYYISSKYNYWITRKFTWELCLSKMRNMSTTILRYLNSISAKLSFFHGTRTSFSHAKAKKAKKAFFEVYYCESKFKNSTRKKYILVVILYTKFSLKKYVWSRSTEKRHFGGRGYKYCKCQWSSAAWSNNSGRYYMTNRTYILSKTKMQRQTIQGTK